MNWNCIVCGDEYALNPKPSKHKGYGTLGDGQDTKFICPVHLDKVVEYVQELKQQERQPA